MKFNIFLLALFIKCLPASSLHAQSILLLARPFLSNQEISDCVNFLQPIPTLHSLLPDTYYSEEGMRMLKIYRPLKQKAKNISQVIKRACMTNLPYRVMTTIMLDVLVNGTMLMGYLQTNRSDAFYLDRKLKSLDPQTFSELKKNAVEEIPIVIDYFAYGTGWFSPEQNFAIFQYFSLHFELLELTMNPKHFTQEFYRLANTPKTLTDLRDWLPLLNRKPTNSVNSSPLKTTSSGALELICRSREFTHLKVHFGREAKEDFCLQRFFLTTQMQLNEALYNQCDKHILIPMVTQEVQQKVQKELQKHRIPSFSNITSNTVDYLNCVKAVDQTFKKLIPLPSFFRLFLTDKQFEKLSSMFLRDSLMAIQRRVFPRYQHPQDVLLTLRIASELKLSAREYYVIEIWHQHLLSGGQILFDDSTYPPQSLYIFTMQLIIIMEISLRDNKKEEVESTIRMGVAIVSELKGRVKDAVMRVRIEMMFQTVKFLANQHRQLKDYLNISS